MTLSLFEIDDSDNLTDRSRFMKGAPVSDERNSGGDAHREAPAQNSCTKCGGSTLPLSILDSRKGKDFRLRRCSDCGELSWAEHEHE